MVKGIRSCFFPILLRFLLHPLFLFRRLLISTNWCVSDSLFVLPCRVEITTQWLRSCTVVWSLLLLLVYLSVLSRHVGDNRVAAALWLALAALWLRFFLLLVLCRVRPFQNFGAYSMWLFFILCYVLVHVESFLKLAQRAKTKKIFFARNQ